MKRASKTCPLCGQKMEAKVTVCPACGYSEEANPTQSTERPSLDLHIAVPWRALLRLVVLIAIVGGCGAAWYYLKPVPIMTVREILADRQQYNDRFVRIRGYLYKSLPGPKGRRRPGLIDRRITSEDAGVGNIGVKPLIKSAQDGEAYIVSGYYYADTNTIGASETARAPEEKAAP